MKILKARILHRLPVPSPGNLLDPGNELGSPALKSDSLPSGPPGKPHKTSNLYVKQANFQTPPEAYSICNKLDPQISIINQQHRGLADIVKMGKASSVNSRVAPGRTE